MSIAPTGALPTALAADRRPSTADAAATKAATQFERVLLEQLTNQLSATAAPDDDEASAATAAYRDMLPATMADALSKAGGIGIAAQLTRATSAAAADTTTTTTATSAAATTTTTATTAGTTTPIATPTPTGTPS